VEIAIAAPSKQKYIVQLQCFNSTSTSLPSLSGKHSRTHYANSGKQLAVANRRNVRVQWTKLLVDAECVCMNWGTNGTITEVVITLIAQGVAAKDFTSRQYTTDLGW